MSYAGRPVFPAGAHVPNNCVTTFWIAIEDVNEDMGCMEFIPGMQDGPMPEHCVFSGEPMAELHVMPRAFHAFDAHPTAEVAVRARALRLDALERALRPTG
jgi:Phytanoyl-CoA dioxygenase (PhyH)